MKTLIERMKAEHIADLNKAKELYPVSVGLLINELETKKFFGHLTFDVIGVLVSHLGLKNYDPGTISSVFRYE